MHFLSHFNQQFCGAIADSTCQRAPNLYLEQSYASHWLCTEDKFDQLVREPTVSYKKPAHYNEVVKQNLTAQDLCCIS